MKFVLSAERSLIEPYLVNIERYLVGLPAVVEGSELGQALRYYIYTVFSQYLYHVHSHAMSPPDIEYLMDEYLNGQWIPQERRYEAMGVIANNLAHAHVAIRPIIAQMVAQLEGYGEEIDDMHFDFNRHHPNPRNQLAILIVETCPVDMGFHAQEIYAQRRRHSLPRFKSQYMRPAVGVG